MNWQTEKILERAREEIRDEGVFTPDQINALERMIDRISEAMDKESSCISAAINHTY